MKAKLGDVIVFVETCSKLMDAQLPAGPVARWLGRTIRACQLCYEAEYRPHIEQWLRDNPEKHDGLQIKPAYMPEWSEFTAGLRADEVDAPHLVQMPAAFLDTIPRSAAQALAMEWLELPEENA